LQHNVFEKYSVDKYLTDHGLVINRDYRQRGIAGEFMKARIQVAKALDIRVVSSVFTAVGSQKAAEKIGFRESFSISFDELGKVFPSFNFSKTSAYDVKVLDYKI
jgi:N-acetylglutamate synthase-like GNAT family acetyltransferase